MVDNIQLSFELEKLSTSKGNPELALPSALKLIGPGFFFLFCFVLFCFDECNWHLSQMVSEVPDKW